MSFSPIATLQTNLWGEASKRIELQVFFFSTATESPPRNRQKVSLHLFVLKLVLFTAKRFLMSFVLLYLASLLSSTPQLHFPFALFVLSLCTFFSHSCFILSLPLQWACSLNHIRDGGFATSHPLH